MKISEALKRFRVGNGLTQKDVAKAASIVPQQWQKYEYGQIVPSAELIVKIAEVYKVSADYLLGLSNVPRPVGVEETEVKKAREFRAKALQFSEELRQFADGA